MGNTSTAAACSSKTSSITTKPTTIYKLKSSHPLPIHVQHYKEQTHSSPIFSSSSIYKGNFINIFRLIIHATSVFQESFVSFSNFYLNLSTYSFPNWTWHISIHKNHQTDQIERIIWPSLVHIYWKKKERNEYLFYTHAYTCTHW